jgi:N-acetylglucosaminyl-diphospho-decaprenol L-rhamnosyltransferase
MARNTELIRAFVVHWNQPEACAATVAALYAQGVPLTLTVLDNNSAPAAYQELRGNIDSKIDIQRLPENKGWGPALNIAMRGWLDSEQSSYCLIAAHDASLAPDCISLLVEAMVREEQIGIACPQYSDCVVPRLSVLHGVQMNFDVAKARGVVQFIDVPHGTLMLLRRECLGQIGLFDERYFAYGDEHELGARALRDGWKIGLVWGALVTNPETSTPSAWRNYLFARNSLLLVQTYYGRVAALFRAIVILINTLRPIFSEPPKDFASSAKARLRGVRDHFCGRYGKPTL